MSLRGAEQTVPLALPLVGAVASVALLAAPSFVEQVTLLEAAGGVAYAWSVGLLAANKPAGWWVGLLGCALYAELFRRSGLVLEAWLMVFYFVTSLQAIVVWLRGGAKQTERPVARLPVAWLAVTLPAAVATFFGLRALSVQLGGVLPEADALVTTLSLVAHVWLMFRFVEAWPVWLLVDTLAVPLYASRGLWVSAVLYAAFWGLATNGWRTFRRELEEKP